MNVSSVCVYCQLRPKFLTRQICQRKVFSDTFFRKVSSGSHSIKGVSRIKEIQNECIRSISPCQMFYIKYSVICLFALSLFDVCWGVVTHLFDMKQTDEHWLMEDGGLNKRNDSLKSNVFFKHLTFVLATVQGVVLLLKMILKPLFKQVNCVIIIIWAKYSDI